MTTPVIARSRDEGILTILKQVSTHLSDAYSEMPKASI